MSCNMYVIRKSDCDCVSYVDTRTTEHALRLLADR